MATVLEVNEKMRRIRVMENSTNNPEGNMTVDKAAMAATGYQADDGRNSDNRNDVPRGLAVVVVAL